jgi:alcohol dehydrogenase YqhD (iron-dependent ADH family)
MDNFQYFNPTQVVFGKNTIESIGKNIKKDKITKVMLLAGSGSIKQNGVYDKVVKSLNSSQIEFVEYWGVRPNPTLVHAEEVKAFAKANNIDGILAVGGGSVIDEAKSISGGYYLDSIWDLFGAKVQPKAALPIYVILTLSATGTEMNSFAVLSNEDEKRKWSFGSPLVYPKISIIDPSVQATLPKRQTANGGVDSLSHLMENYFMSNLNNEIGLTLNEVTQRTVISQIDNLMENPNDYTARANFAWSSTIALNGMTSIGMLGGEWTSHAIEHALSILNPEVAHAEGLSVIFPAFINYVYDAKPEIFDRWAANVYGIQNGLEGTEVMKSKFKSWSSPTTLRELGFSKSDYPEIIKCIEEYGRTGRIKQLSEESFIKILDLAY